MNARRLVLVLAAAVMVVSLMTSYLGRAETAAKERRAPPPSAEPIPTALDAHPGEVAWASWHVPAAVPEADGPAPMRDIRAEEAAFADLPDAVRARLEADYEGLDVALPRRNR